MSAMQDYTEIPLQEIAAHAAIVREALEDVCASSSFRTSPKSCDFLRHIVDRVIAGETDELKERLIGMSLLGREATYDTASDAGVRVRANDVRKRLKTYNTAREERGPGTFELPSGSYIPRFYRRGAALSGMPPAAPVSLPAIYPAIPAISLQRLAAPTFVALFLCTMCLRWQIAQEHPFTTFWQSIFQHGPVLLYLPPATPGPDRMVGMQELQASASLLNLAGQFRTEVKLADSSQAIDDETLIAVGGSANAELPAGNGRLAVVNTPAGRRIIDREHPGSSLAGNAAAGLLTIENSPTRRITIDGTDSQAIGRLVRLLCDRDTFPDVVADNDQTGDTVQIMFPMSAGAQPALFRETARASAESEGDHR